MCEDCDFNLFLVRELSKYWLSGKYESIIDVLDI